MKSWNPFEILTIITGNQRNLMKDRAIRWTRALRTDAKLREDLIELGGVLSQAPVRLEGGIEQPDPIDPVRLAYEQGRKDMALSILAMGGIDNYELSKLMEDTNGL